MARRRLDARRRRRGWGPAAPPYQEQAGDHDGDHDVPYAPGSARAALAHREFRLVWSGAFASNIGTWMQNVALGVFAYKISRSATYVALLGFAQLGPQLVLAVVGGALADIVDRKRMLIACQVEQAVMSLVLAWAAAARHPSKAGIFACVFAVGVGSALNNPAFAAVLPMLVGRRDLSGAVSLQSVQMNLSRVVGPAIGGVLLPAITAAGVFALNAATYVFAIATLAAATLPRTHPTTGERGVRRLLGGITVARAERVVRQCLVTIATISFCCLPFIGLMPVLAAENLHIRPDSAAYGGLYALFGLGAAAGAVSVGTVFVGASRRRMVRAGLASFAAALAAFALIRSADLAYPVAAAVGYTYFLTVTSLSTALQESIADNVRGRVMALWQTGFGGTVPLGLLAGGAVASHTSITAVVLGGAVVAAVLAAVVRLAPTGPPGPAPVG